MATFILTAKIDIGSVGNKVYKGQFIQIGKDSNSTPSTTEINKAIKEQLHVSLNSTPHLGQFNWKMI